MSAELVAQLAELTDVGPDQDHISRPVSVRFLKRVRTALETFTHDASPGVSLPSELFIRFGEDGRNIRLWKTQAFPGGMRFVRFDRDPADARAALTALVTALAPVMPSEAASPHASREWQAARECWHAALGVLQVGEDQVRAPHANAVRTEATDFRALARKLRDALEDAAAWCEEEADACRGTSRAVYEPTYRKAADRVREEHRKATS